MLLSDAAQRLCCSVMLCGGRDWNLGAKRWPAFDTGVDQACGRTGDMKGFCGAERVASVAIPHLCVSSRAAGGCFCMCV